MTANEIFKSMLGDSILVDKYNLSEESIEELDLHVVSEIDLVEIIKIALNGVENSTPDRTINSQVRNYFSE